MHTKPELLPAELGFFLNREFLCNAYAKWSQEVYQPMAEDTIHEANPDKAITTKAVIVVIPLGTDPPVPVREMVAEDPSRQALREPRCREAPKAAGAGV